MKIHKKNENLMPTYFLSWLPLNHPGVRFPQSQPSNLRVYDLFCVSQSLDHETLTGDLNTSTETAPAPTEDDIAPHQWSTAYF